MSDSLEIKKVKAELIFPQENLVQLHAELGNIREEYIDNKYIQEAMTVLKVGGLRSAIGSYWNAVIDDLRRKIIHRSVDLFNKEMNQNPSVKTYEDFQNYVTDYNLIEGAYKIGVLSWEGKKLLHQARETRNIFDGHPDSSNPTIIKVCNMFADCNKYVLSEEPPPSIINTSEYITNMDSPAFHTNELAVAQAFSDLPAIYKSELINKFFTMYLQDNISTVLRGNMEFSIPILWRFLPKEDRQQIGKRFDKELVGGNQDKIEKGIGFMSFVDGLKYTTSVSRKIIFEPAIKYLENNLDNWQTEGEAVKKLLRLGSVIPKELIDRYVTALILTYLGFGQKYYSWSAASTIVIMFQRFDNTSIEAFVKAVKGNKNIRDRISYPNKMERLRTLANTLLTETSPRDDLREYLELITDSSRTREFYTTLERKKK